MRTLYFDCFAGVSGNMILGGLAALGVDQDHLVQRLRAAIPVGFEIQLETVDRSGVSAVHVNVSAPDEKHHRHLSDIEKIIDAASTSDQTRDRAKQIFRNLANAEAKVHGIDVGRVHFHEVGAMDAIVDIIGACIGFEMLGIEKFACSKIHVGSGFIEIAHGRFPVPPPAVTELLRGIPYYSTDIEGELATPTGVAIVATLCDEFGSLDEFVPEQTAYGAGTRTYDNFPNVIRMIVGESIGEARATTRLTLLETNIDDLSPQILGYVMDRAFEIGALDCWFTPIQMKKNRPAAMLSILCESAKREPLTELIYIETSTLGIRVREIERECLEREIISVSTEYGLIDVKIGKLNGRIVNAMPEYDQVKEAAERTGVPFRVVRDRALATLKDATAKTAAG